MSDLDRMIRTLETSISPELIDPVLAYKRLNQPVTVSQGYARAILERLKELKALTDIPEEEPTGRTLW